MSNRQALLIPAAAPQRLCCLPSGSLAHKLFHILLAPLLLNVDPVTPTWSHFAVTCWSSATFDFLSCQKFSLQSIQLKSELGSLDAYAPLKQTDSYRSCLKRSLSFVFCLKRRVGVAVCGNVSQTCRSKQQLSRGAALQVAIRNKAALSQSHARQTLHLALETLVPTS